MISSMTKSYSELIRFNSFEERFNYLKLDGIVGQETFGFDRYLNQRFYQSQEWKLFKRSILIRDNGCDLGLDGYEIRKQPIYIHHINPISPEDLQKSNMSILLNPENVICVSFNTHQAIHYGDSESLKTFDPVIRKPNDTCPWKG